MGGSLTTPVAWDGRNDIKNVGSIKFGIRIFVAGGPAPRAHARGAAAGGETVYGKRIQIRFVMQAYLRENNFIRR